MAEGEKYINCENSGLGTQPLLKLLTRIDGNMNPFFATNANNDLPPPPYIVARNSTQTISEITGFIYENGDGPSLESISFRVKADGLLPTSGNITMTVPANYEISVDNGDNWQDTPVLIGYTGGAITTALIYKLRLKAGLPVGNYNEILILSGANAPDFNLNLVGEVIYNQEFIFAEGGDITFDGDYKIHTFLEDDNFNVLFVPAIGPNNVLSEILVVGGGGGGGGWIFGAGGGAGGYRTSNNHAVTVQSYSIVVGAGGVGGPNAGNDAASNGTSGANSSFDGIEAAGGGFGVSYSAGGNPGNGGSGGGAQLTSSQLGFGNTPPTVPPQGHDGGAGGIAGGGGGGGADLVGDTAALGGAGGAGLQNDITGTLTYYAGGGSGAQANSLTITPGSLGGGGASGTPNGENGVDGLGGGGGGAGVGAGIGEPAGIGGKGGDGVIIIRYRFQ